jgi:hypothetical protein
MVMRSTTVKNVFNAIDASGEGVISTAQLSVESFAA